MGRRARLPLFAAGAALLAGATWLLADRLEDTIFLPRDHPAIQYAGETTDPVGRLAKRLASGQVKLDYAPGAGYLPALLKELGINADSQVLVFSRTSIQADRISPRTPRAIYFNDDVSVGYVQNSEVLELTSLDPKQGVILYSLDAVRSPRPALAQRRRCVPSPRHVHRQALHSPQEHNTRAATERARDAQGGHSSGHNAHIRHLLISITSP